MKTNVRRKNPKLMRITLVVFLMILQKFVRRVEIGTASVKINWNVDKQFYINEISQAKACGSFKLVNGSGNVGSNSLTIGALRGT